MRKPQRITVYLEPLRRVHAQALRRFECENRLQYEAFNEPLPHEHYTDPAVGICDEWLERCHQGTACYLVACRSRHCVIGRGVMHLLEDAPGVSVIAFQTDQRFQGMGIASALVEALSEIALASGVRLLEAVVAVDNLASIRVLLKSGFTPAEAAAPAVLRRGSVACIRMRRQLRSAAMAEAGQPQVWNGSARTL